MTRERPRAGTTLAQTWAEMSKAQYSNVKRHIGELSLCINGAIILKHG